MRAAGHRRRLRPGLLHEPQRGAAALRVALDARRPRAGGRHGRGDRPGHGARAARHGIEPTWCPSASWPRAARGAARTSVEGRRVLVARAAEARDVLPDGLRERGARWTWWRSTTPCAEPLDASSCEALARATYVTFTSSSTVRFFLDGGGARSTAPGWSRSGRSRARPLREHGIEPHVEAERHDIDGLVDALVEDAGCPRDRHAAHRLRPRRRLRGRLPRRDPRHPPRRRIVDITHGIRATPCARARSCCATRCRTCRSACTWRWWTRRWAPSGGRWRCARRRPHPGGAGQRAAQPRLGALRRGASRRWTSRARRTGSSPCRPPSTVATSSPRGRAPRRGAELADAGDPLDPAELRAVDLPEPHAQDDALVAHALVVDRFGNVGLDVATRTSPGTGITLGGTVEIEAAGERYLATYAQTFADVQPGELIVYEDAYRTLAVAINRGDAAGTLALRAGLRGAAAAAMIGSPRVHHRLTDSTNERASELGAGRRAARHARHGRRADRRPRAPGPGLERAAGSAVLMSVVLRDLDEPRAAAGRRGGGLRGAASPAARSSGRTTSGSRAASSPASWWRAARRRAGRCSASA